ncbi:unnamed protein product [Meloidogyne enterolobii]|uniref:Uncharacterized protein n=2 Tax=Meloidogyne enterolobii TaxID=390850 RepID=A0ACB0ZF51_MELEN
MAGADAAAGGFFLWLYVMLIFIWSCLPCIIICVTVGGTIGLIAYCINKSNREERENAMRIQQMVIQRSNSNVNV